MTDVSILVQADADDAEEEGSPNEFSSTTTGLGSLAGGFGGGTLDAYAGFRFAHADLPPQGATIDDADILGVAVDTTNDNIGSVYRIYCEAVDASANFTDTADVIDRALTTAFTNAINKAAVSATTHETLSSTGEITDEVQEVVDQPGWDEAAITVLLRYQSSGASRSNGLQIRSHENSSTLCARLDISYTAAAAATQPPRTMHQARMRRVA